MAVYFQLPALPFQDELIDAAKLVSAAWNRYLAQLVKRVELGAWTVGATSLTGQTAAVAATALGDTLIDGLYRVDWHARITTAASVSSSLTVTVTWTDGGVAQSYSGAAITGNTTTSVQSAGLPLIHCDAGTTVQYAAAYSSTGTAMAYRLDVALLKVSS